MDKEQNAKTHNSHLIKISSQYKKIQISNSSTKKLNRIYTFLLIISYLTQIKTRKISCNELNFCKITYDSGTEYIPSAFGANSNFFQEKYVKANSEKNEDQITKTTSSIFTTKFDPKVEMLFGSQNFQCADGLDECPGKCCKLGFCADPSNVCLRKKADRNLIFVITGSLFSVFVIAYWIVFFFLGIKYNSTFSDGSNIKELDMIYRKPFKKVENAEAPPDTEFNPNANYEQYVRKKEENGVIDDLNNINKNNENANENFNHHDKEVNKFSGNESFTKRNKAKFANYAFDDDLDGNQFANNNLHNENEIIEEDQNINVLGSHNFDNAAAAFSYNRFEETKSTRVFGANSNIYNPLLKSSSSYNFNNNYHNNANIINKEENNYKIISNDEEQCEKQDNQKLNKIIEEDGNNIKVKNANLIQNSIKAFEDKMIEKDLNIYNRISLDSESKRDNQNDIFSSQSSFPSKSVNSKRRLIKRLKISKNENPIGSVVSGTLDEKENLNFKCDKDLESNQKEINEGENFFDNYEVDNKKGI